MKSYNRGNILCESKTRQANNQNVSLIPLMQQLFPSVVLVGLADLVYFSAS